MSAGPATLGLGWTLNGLGLLIAGPLGVDEEVTVFEPIAGVSIVPALGGGFTGLMLDARF